mmetsp:Transcript_32894/g.84052  ORF Transcript_32894/g.84052 Transcript_32894/m.84052 type:complete len:202 (+) Transcript_32894:494-1099(+)
MRSGSVGCRPRPGIQRARLHSCHQHLRNPVAVLPVAGRGDKQKGSWLAIHATFEGPGARRMRSVAAIHRRYVEGKDDDGRCGSSGHVSHALCGSASQEGRRQVLHVRAAGPGCATVAGACSKGATRRLESPRLSAGVAIGRLLHMFPLDAVRPGGGTAAADSVGRAHRDGTHQARGQGAALPPGGAPWLRAGERRRPGCRG